MGGILAQTTFVRTIINHKIEVECLFDTGF